MEVLPFSAPAFDFNPYIPNHFPVLINWTSPFLILGLLGGIFHFYFLKETSVSKQGEPDQTPRFAASDLVLHPLPMSHKKDPRLILFKMSILYSAGLIIMLSST